MAYTRKFGHRIMYCKPILRTSPSRPLLSLSLSSPAASRLSRQAQALSLTRTHTLSHSLTLFLSLSQFKVWSHSIVCNSSFDLKTQETAQKTFQDFRHTARLRFRLRSRSVRDHRAKPRPMMKHAQWHTKNRHSQHTATTPAGTNARNVTSPSAYTAQYGGTRCCNSLRGPPRRATSTRSAPRVAGSNPVAA